MYSEPELTRDISSFNKSILEDNSKDNSTTKSLFRIYCFFAFYFILPFIPLGIIFNLLSLVIFSRTSLGTTSSTRVYYLVMAYSELTIVFLKDFWFFWLGVGFPSVFYMDPLSVINLNPHSQSSLGPLCNIMIFLYFVHEMMANMTFIIFAMERVFALYYPFASRIWFNQMRSLVAVVVLLILAAALSVVTFWLSERVPLPGLVFTNFQCTQSTENKHPLVMAFGSILYLTVFILPALLSATCSIIIIIKMRYVSSNLGVCTVQYSTL